jgi:threonyl-tRNA synthetase
VAALCIVMRVLYIHAKKFWYKVREMVKVPVADLAEVGDGAEFENALVVFVSVERGDDDSVVEQAVKDIEEVVRNLRADYVVLYPYAHLSSELAKPRDAVEILDKLEDAASRRGLKVHRSPFGWYKEFMLHCIGHPLAELSRTFKPAA